MGGGAVGTGLPSAALRVRVTLAVPGEHALESIFSVNLCSLSPGHSLQPPGVVSKSRRTGCWGAGAGRWGAGRMGVGGWEVGRWEVAGGMDAATEQTGLQARSSLSFWGDSFLSLTCEARGIFLFLPTAPESFQAGPLLTWVLHDFFMPIGVCKWGVGRGQGISPPGYSNSHYRQYPLCLPWGGGLCTEAGEPLDVVLGQLASQDGRALQGEARTGQDSSRRRRRESRRAGLSPSAWRSRPRGAGSDFAALHPLRQHGRRLIYRSRTRARTQPADYPALSIQTGSQGHEAASKGLDEAFAVVLITYYRSVSRLSESPGREPHSQGGPRSLGFRRSRRNVA